MSVSVPAATPIVPEAMVKMSIGLMLIGAVIMFVSFVFIYNLGKKEVAAMQGKLNETDTEAAAEPISEG